MTACVFCVTTNPVLFQVKLPPVPQAGMPNGKFIHQDYIGTRRQDKRESHYHSYFDILFHHNREIYKNPANGFVFPGSERLNCKTRKI
jgi:hypothetical protein